MDTLQNASNFVQQVFPVILMTNEDGKINQRNKNPNRQNLGGGHDTIRALLTVIIYML